MLSGVMISTDLGRVPKCRRSYKNRPKSCVSIDTGKTKWSLYHQSYMDTVTRASTGYKYFGFFHEGALFV